MQDIFELHVLPGCEKNAAFIKDCGLRLAEAFIPSQPLDSIFSPHEGLLMGTVFPNLVRPYSYWR